ncbi:MAG: LCP family protein [Clostridia bacterium]|nr:LCP family protein [Clostridia bacterium]
MRHWKRLMSLLVLLAAAVVFAMPPAVAEQDADGITFMLICNEGMQNDSGDVGNTIMLIHMLPDTGIVKQVMLNWDMFVDYPGYDLPQLFDHPFRVGGPEETLRIFNENFDMDVQSYLSINFLNLASLIDYYGGVTLDVTREERNALNDMVGSKRREIEVALGSLELDATLFDALFETYYLDSYGSDVHLSGLQAVGYGWLQYDSVANCCLRDVKVIAQLFFQVEKTAEQRLVFYDSESGEPDVSDGRFAINLDDMSQEDAEQIERVIRPIFDESAHNLTSEQRDEISLAMIRSVYEANKAGIEQFEQIEYIVLPLEYQQEYTTIGGIDGHVIDKQANIHALRQFLQGD